MFGMSFNFLGGLHHSSFNDSRARRPRQLTLGLEALEDRLVMSNGVFTSDYTQIAGMFPRHEGPTNLYLNFDGWAAENVAGFSGTDQDIQDIIFRVSEIFSPFDVQVRRAFGDGAHVQSGGHSTIFIGDAARFGIGSQNKVGGVTPIWFADMPGIEHGFEYIPNSNPYGVGYVDPDKSMLPLAWDNERIARVIAHEAGHTFGLGHSANPPWGAPPDIMSYDAENIHFANHWLPLTDRNGHHGTNKSVLPGWHFIQEQLGLPKVIPYFLGQQNSFLFLQSVVGSRPADDFGNLSVAHVESVDGPLSPNFILGTSSSIGTFIATRSGGIDRHGDHDVIFYRALRNETVTFQVRSGAFLGLHSPEILAYRDKDLTAFNSVALGTGTVQITLPMLKNEGVEFVMGGLNGDSVGTYELTVTGRTGRPKDDRFVLSDTVFDPGSSSSGGGTVNPGLLTTTSISTQTAAASMSIAPSGPAGQPVGASALATARTSSGGNAARDAVFADLGRSGLKPKGAPAALSTALAAEAL